MRDEEWDIRVTLTDFIFTFSDSMWRRTCICNFLNIIIRFIIIENDCYIIMEKTALWVIIWPWWKILVISIAKRLILLIIGKLVQDCILSFWFLIKDQIIIISGIVALKLILSHALSNRGWRASTNGLTLVTLMLRAMEEKTFWSGDTWNVLSSYYVFISVSIFYLLAIISGCTELIKANVDIVKVDYIKGLWSVNHRVCSPIFVLLLRCSEVHINLACIDQLISTTSFHSFCYLPTLLLNRSFLWE